MGPVGLQSRLGRVHRVGREMVTVAAHLHGVVRDHRGCVGQGQAEWVQGRAHDLLGPAVQRGLQTVDVGHRELGVRGHLPRRAGAGHGPHRPARQQPRQRLPVQGKRDGDAVPGLCPEAVDQHVRCLGHPVVDGGAGQFHPPARGIVGRHTGAGRIGGDQGTPYLARGPWCCRSCWGIGHGPTLDVLFGKTGLGRPVGVG